VYTVRPDHPVFYFSCYASQWLYRERLQISYLGCPQQVPATVYKTPLKIGVVKAT